MSGGAESLFPVFIGLWAALGLFSAGFFFLNRNASLKRKVWPPFVAAVALLFAGFAWALGVPEQLFYFLVPATVLITVLNLRAVQFCDACGSTVMNQNPFMKPEFCSKCGAKLGKP